MKLRLEIGLPYSFFCFFTYMFNPLTFVISRH